MGDFNAVSNLLTDRNYNKQDQLLPWKPEIKMFNFLNDWTFIDIHYIWEDEFPSHTWKVRNLSSRIDYIWISLDKALHNLHSFENQEANSILNSDHTLFSLILYINNLFKTPTSQPSNRNINKKNNKIIFINITQSTKEQWTNFSNKFDENLNKTNFDTIAQTLLFQKITIDN